MNKENTVKLKVGTYYLVKNKLGIMSAAYEAREVNDTKTRAYFKEPWGVIGWYSAETLEFAEFDYDTYYKVDGKILKPSSSCPYSTPYLAAFEITPNNFHCTHYRNVAIATTEEVTAIQELANLTLEVEEERLNISIQKRVKKKRDELEDIRRGVKSLGSWWTARVDMTPLSLLAIIAAVTGISAFATSIVALLV